MMALKLILQNCVQSQAVNWANFDWYWGSGVNRLVYPERNTSHLDKYCSQLQIYPCYKTCRPGFFYGRRYQECHAYYTDIYTKV